MRIRHLHAALLLVPLALSGCGYNQIQSLDEAAEEKKSQIGVVLQQRNQLIPNLVETVRGAAGFERGTYTDVAAARSGLPQAERGLQQAQQQVQQAVQSGNVNQIGQADQALTRQIGTFLNVAVEAYPQLRATQNFTALQDELSAAENRIAVARQDYNRAARDYNTYIRQFPQALTARASGAERKAFLETPAGAEQTPQVKF